MTSSKRSTTDAAQAGSLANRVGAAPAALAGRGRVRCDQRGTGLACSRERLLDPIVDRDVLAQAHGDTVGALLRTVVVVGQLEAGNHEEVVGVERARGLGFDRRQVLAVVAGVHVIVRRPACDDVVGHAENVETGIPVEIDELGERQHPVAPGGVCVELAKERMAVIGHTCIFGEKPGGSWPRMVTIRFRGGERSLRRL